MVGTADERPFDIAAVQEAMDQKTPKQDGKALDEAAAGRTSEGAEQAVEAQQAAADAVMTDDIGDGDQKPPNAETGTAAEVEMTDATATAATPGKDTMAAGSSETKMEAGEPQTVVDLSSLVGTTSVDGGALMASMPSGEATEAAKVTEPSGNGNDSVMAHLFGKRLRHLTV